MSHVLIIDAPPVFRDFMNEKIYAAGVTVSTVSGYRDAFVKTLSIMPDLIILDLRQNGVELMIDYFQRKSSNVNTASIPIILTGSALDQNLITKLAHFKVIKYFNRPFKITVFFELIARVFGVSLPVDPTESIVKIISDEKNIYIELERGLNREKIAMLEYKIKEIIDEKKLHSLNIILLMNNITLDFSDTVNLEFLVNTVLSHDRVTNENLKILSNNLFMHSFMGGHDEYADIQIARNIPNLLTAQIQEKITNTGDNITEGIFEISA